MTAPPDRDPAGFATYPGDLMAMVGEAKGPDHRGRFVIAAGAEYDRWKHCTHVAWVYATDDDMLALANGQAL